ncbi:MAG TPA: LacI family DNA-binding transcriptional regulator [Rhizomicrobium sp.]
MKGTPKAGLKAHGICQAAATIYDVADHAGVSKTTVSRVLNGEANVRPATRAVVLKAVKELQFLPNRAARSLASQVEARVGLLYNNPSTAYFSEFLIGALDGSGRNGAQLVVDKCKIGNVEAASEAVHKLVKGGVNGMVLTAPISESAELIEELTEAGISIVAVATGRFSGNVTCVGIDDFKAAYEMTNYLIGLGHRRIGFVKGHPSHTSGVQRARGFEAALRDAGGKVEKPMIAQGYYSYRSGLDAGEQLLSGRKLPTAIFASNDDMASGVMAVAHRKNLSVPRDLSIVGFDDTIAGAVWPGLTTIRQPISDIAAMAIDVIVRNIRDLRAGEKETPQNHLVPHKLIERESAAAPRT